MQILENFFFHSVDDVFNSVFTVNVGIVRCDGFDFGKHVNHICHFVDDVLFMDTM